MAKDLYAVLGISRSASADDIKKAYRALSKEWHPDKHKGEKAAEERFKEINEAYEVLSDPQKRQMYDQFGSTGGPGGGGQGFGGFDFGGFGQGADFGDLFEGFFGGGRGRATQRTEGADREIEVTINFMDAVNGIKQSVRLQRLSTCGTCEGAGAENGSNIVTCATCGGTGQTTRTMNSFFGQIQQRGICTTCNGIGKVPEKPCRTCGGDGRVNGTSEVVIDVPAGIDTGQTLRIRGQGDAGIRKAALGDLYVHVRVIPDARFERDGDDIRSSVAVPVIDALLGGSVEVETVQGTTTVQIPEGMQPGQVFRIRGKGMPQLGSSRHGDHYVSVSVEIPQKLSRKERKLMEEWREARREAE